MSEDSCGINYDDSESLKAGADYEKSAFPCAELHIVDKSKSTVNIFPRRHT